MERILAAATAIAGARRSRAPLKALAKDVVPRDEAEGYQVQYALHDLLQPQVGSLVGYKI
ncbi:MAG TPA: hydratase, partial [Bradyrhizobium sp.]